MPSLASDPYSLTDDQLHRMNVSREFLMRRNEEKARLDAQAPRVGDPAPPFLLARLVTHRAQTAGGVSLAELLGRPVALIFGSYTCPVYRRQIGRFNSAWRQYSRGVHFLGIYIREAHPLDGWRVPQNDSLECAIYQPTTAEERARIASHCAEQSDVQYPLAIDSMGDQTMIAFAGTPERLYALDSQGIVRFKSAIGPFDDVEIDLWEQTLAALST